MRAAIIWPDTRAAAEAAAAESALAAQSLLPVLGGGVSPGFMLATLLWLRAQQAMTFVLRGDALAPTHEVNPLKPVSETIAGHHDRTVEQVARALAATLVAPGDDDEFLLLESSVMNHALRKHVLKEGADTAMWRIVF